jgi:hypothetical protein
MAGALGRVLQEEEDRKQAVVFASVAYLFDPCQRRLFAQAVGTSSENETLEMLQHYSSDESDAVAEFIHLALKFLGVDLEKRPFFLVVLAVMGVIKIILDDGIIDVSDFQKAAKKVLGDDAVAGAAKWQNGVAFQGPYKHLDKFVDLDSGLKFMSAVIFARREIEGRTKPK